MAGRARVRPARKPRTARARQLPAKRELAVALGLSPDHRGRRLRPAAYTALPAPTEQLTHALAAAAGRMGRYTGSPGYQLLGLDVLRDAVADRFTRRGLPTNREEVLITCGGQRAIALALGTLTAPADRVLVEHPTYPNALDAVARQHARAVPVGFPAIGIITRPGCRQT